MITILSVLLFSGATLANAACSATISSLSGTPWLLSGARHGSHIYRRGQRCEMYHNNTQRFHRASGARLEFKSSDRHYRHDE